MRTLTKILAFSMLVAGCAVKNAPVNEIRPPAAPLVTVDPYFSVWSFTDELNQSPTLHWTGQEHPLIAVVRVDGVSYRAMGVESSRYEQVLPTGEMEAWTGKYLIDSKPKGDWTATLVDDRAVFDALVNPDWVDIIDLTHEAFQARSVVGGLWIKMLAEELL